MNKTIKNFALQGILNQNKDLLINRLVEILNEDMLDVVTEGVPTSARITDKEGLCEYIHAENVVIKKVCWDHIELKRVTKHTKYFKSAEDAEFFSISHSVYKKSVRMDSSDSKSDDYLYAGNYISDDCYILDMKTAENFMEINRM